MGKPTKKPAPPANVIPLPPDWKSAFQGHAMRTSFCLALTQPMLEFLCATADGVHWDRYLYHRQFGMAKPDSMFASGDALIKRGLIERLGRAEISGQPMSEYHLHAHYRLTPAGEALVALLKVAGIFIEADAAIEKRTKAR
jgi:hypothetical protein